MNIIRNISLTTFITSFVFFSGCGGGSAGDGSSDSSNEPLRIAYSDWPGWVAWEIGIQKGFFNDAGVNVEFTWLDYVASMDSFAASICFSCAFSFGSSAIASSMFACASSFASLAFTTCCFETAPALSFLNRS